MQKVKPVEKIRRQETSATRVPNDDAENRDGGDDCGQGADC
jgi:hypothetical protein